MNRFIENLETRSLFSAVVGHPVVSAPVVHAAVHATPAPVVVAKFSGNVLDAAGNVIATATMSATKTAKGFSVVFDTVNAANAKVKQHFVFAADASGAFSFTTTSGGVKFQLSGQVSSEPAAVAGTWSQVRKDGSGNGTFSLSLVPPPAPAVKPTPKPAPAPAPAPAAPLMKFTGTSVDSNGKTMNMVMNVVRAGTGYVLEVDVMDAGQTTPSDHLTIPVKADATFTFDRTKDTRKLHVEGKLSGDPKVVTGTWTETRSDGFTTGSFTLTQGTTPAPAPAPAPMPAVTAHYVGTAVDSDNGPSGLTLDVFTVSGSTFGTITHQNHDGSTDTITVKIVDGKFTFGGEGNVDVVLAGSFNAAKTSVTGTFTNSHSNSHGTFSLSRS